MKKLTSLMLKVFMCLLILFTCSSCKSNRELKEVFEYVYDAGTYTELDEDFADKYFLKNYDNYGGGCSAIAKTLENGQTIVGRNMDLNISNKAAYIVRTNVEGHYKTVGLTYTFRDVSPDREEIIKNGLPSDFEKLIPFMADDVLNEKGLYVEVNMRNGEYWPNGDPKFSCSGTNPESDKRVYMFELPRYIGENCATVDEALEYVKTLDIYSKNGYWNYCFIMADATGHYGLLEFAMNQIVWSDYQPCQTNFYVNEILNYLQEYQCGNGRYELLMNNIDSVQSEDDMFNLMKRANYYHIYDPENCEFDYRSESVSVLPYATIGVLTDEKLEEFIDEAMLEMGNEVKALTREEQQNLNCYWETTFTEVVNCNEKTLLVRFFENDDKVIKLNVE